MLITVEKIDPPPAGAEADVRLVVLGDAPPRNLCFAVREAEVTRERVDGETRDGRTLLLSGYVSDGNGVPVELVCAESEIPIRLPHKQAYGFGKHAVLIDELVKLMVRGAQSGDYLPLGARVSGTFGLLANYLTNRVLPCRFGTLDKVCMPTEAETAKLAAGELTISEIPPRYAAYANLRGSRQADTYLYVPVVIRPEDIMDASNYQTIQSVEMVLAMADTMLAELPSREPRGSRKNAEKELRIPPRVVNGPSRVRLPSLR